METQDQYIQAVRYGLKGIPTEPFPYEPKGTVFAVAYEMNLRPDYKQLLFPETKILMGSRARKCISFDGKGFVYSPIQGVIKHCHNVGLHSVKELVADCEDLLIDSKIVILMEDGTFLKYLQF